MRNHARLTLAASVSVVALWLACGGKGGPSNPASPSPDSSLTPTRFHSPCSHRSCSRAREISRTCSTMAQNERVSKLLDGLDGLVFTTGDNAYDKGNAGGIREMLRAHVGKASHADAAVAWQS